MDGGAGGGYCRVNTLSKVQTHTCLPSSTLRRVAARPIFKSESSNILRIRRQSTYPYPVQVPVQVPVPFWTDLDSRLDSRNPAWTDLDSRLDCWNPDWMVLESNLDGLDGPGFQAGLLESRLDELDSSLDGLDGPGFQDSRQDRPGVQPGLLLPP